jgi:exopolysaccharide biosynthesis polyprenyl glycosylphosphotransferase
MPLPVPFAAASKPAMRGGAAVSQSAAVWRLRWVALIAGDVGAAFLAYVTAFLLRAFVPFPLTSDYLPVLRFVQVTHYWLVIAAAQVALLLYFGCYDDRALAEPRRYVASVLAAAVALSLLLVAVYFFRQDLNFPRSVFFIFPALNAPLVILWRSVGVRLLRGMPRRRVLIVGANPTAAEVLRAVRGQPYLGLDVVGIVDAASADADFQGVPIVGGREQLARLVAEHDVDEVVVASDLSWRDRLVDDVMRLDGARARVSVVPSPYEILIGRQDRLRLHDIPLIEVVRTPPGGVSAAAKRGFDVVFGGILLVLLAPLAALVGLAIWGTSGRPILFRQTRVGRGGRPFTLCKFRTMHERAESETGPVLAVANDPRATTLGRWLRAVRLDELPQLWNVVRGDMSFVGPRPERPEFVEMFQADIHGYTERFKVAPGLTGYAQVNGEYHSAPETKLKYDLAYIYNHSLWLDIKILSKTLKVMLTQRGV